MLPSTWRGPAKNQSVTKMIWTGSRHYRDIYCTVLLTGKYDIRPFFGGSGHSAVANPRPAFPKNTYGPVSIPLIRGAGGWTLPPWREWKPGGKAPWGRRKKKTRHRDTLGRIRASTARPAKMLPRTWRGPVRNQSPKWSGPGPDCTGVFVDRPTLRASVAQGLFYGGSRRRAVAHTRPAFPKNALGPIGIPLVRGASGAGHLTQPPSKGGKSLGGRPPEAEGKYSNHQGTPGQIRAPIARPTEMMGWWLVSRVYRGICWPPHLTGKYGTKPFF